MGGAMAHVAPGVLSQLDDLGVDLERIRHLIILHTHYDHLGMAPYLTRQWPWPKVAVSKVGADVLKNQKALKAIQDYNNSMLKEGNWVGQVEPLNLVEEGFPVHDMLFDGMELNPSLSSPFSVFSVPTL